MLLIISNKEFTKFKGKDCDCLLEYESVKDNLIKHKWLSCNKNCSNKIDEKLKKTNYSKTQLSFLIMVSINFLLLLRKGAYLYEYMNEWEKFNEKTLPEKEELYSNFSMKDITDADYMHAKRVCKGFKIKNLGEYHDLYLKSDTLILADVFGKFRKMSLKRYHLDSAKFLSAPRLA